MRAAPAAGALFALLAGGGLPGGPAWAEIHAATPADYAALLSKLRPGDTLELAPGRYTDGLRLHRVNGAPGAPIVIRGSRDAPSTLVARAGANTVSIVESSHLELRDLVLEGNGQFVDAVKAEGHSAWAHHITLDGLTIRGFGAHQQLVGISTKCPAWGWVIRNNVILGAGTGMYLGQSDGSAPFVAGVIERNLIVDSIGYNLQVKHQIARPEIAGMPQSPGITIIRHNVFRKSANSAMGELARPNLLVGHWPRSGPGSDDSYAIYGNFFYQNPAEALFQGEGNLAFYANVLVNFYGDGINIQPHNHIPRRIDVFHNTVLAAGTGIHVRGGDSERTQRVSANAVFATTPIVGGEQHGNRTGTLVEAAGHLSRPFALPGRLALVPLPGRLGTGEMGPMQESLPDANRDFDGRRFARPMAGAYSGPRALKPLTIEPAR